jgi:tetraacyldisaccharide 4'-kinase
VIPLLKPVELAWRSVNRARRAAYRAGLLRARTLPKPVISIGNISAGGSGKTPVVIWAARQLIEKKFRVAVLTRGYRRSGDDEWAMVEYADAARFGDEPVMIRRAVPEADVIVGANRWLSGSQYLDEHDCDVFLLDDGFQHLQLKRDLDVVIDDGRAAWMREGRSALRDADVVLIRSENVDTTRGSNSSPSAAISTPFSILTVGIAVGDETHEPQWLDGRAVVVFAGLGNNEQFFESVCALGARVVESLGFPDHHAYRDRDLEDLRSIAAQNDAVLLTTEKDLVKLPSTKDVAAVVVEAVIESSESVVERLVDVVRGNAGR